MLPSTRTFDVPELHELILEYATPQDLFLWQRVNKSWQAAIQTSPRIQEKLFYRAKTSAHSHDPSCVAWNPFIGLFSTDHHFSHWRLPTIDAFNGKASHPTASWRQMLMSSPAVTEVIALSNHSTKETLTKSIICETGVTLGQLVDFQKEGIGLRDHGFEVESFWVPNDDFR